MFLVVPGLFLAWIFASAGIVSSNLRTGWAVTWCAVVLLLFTGMGVVLYWHTHMSAAEAPGPATLTRQAFSSTQRINTLYVGKDDALNLDNVATLRLFVPSNDSMVSLLLNSSPVVSTEEVKKGPYTSKGTAFIDMTNTTAYTFDTGLHKEHDVPVGNRTFVVTLLQINKLDSRVTAVPLEYVFGISEK
jgi:hypothetical protein